MNPYGVYNYCYHDSDEESEKAQKTVGRKSLRSDYTPWLHQSPALKANKLGEIPPCTYGSVLINYYNLPEVKEALHIKDTAFDWDLCSQNINYNQLYEGSQWVYAKYHSDYRMLKYSGDTDGVVSTTGTLHWLNELQDDLKLSVEVEWYPYFAAGQVAGYYMQYEGDLTFATVHGAGHMVPTDKPSESYVLFKNWIKGDLPPT